MMATSRESPAPPPDAIMADGNWDKSVILAQYLRLHSGPITRIDACHHGVRAGARFQEGIPMTISAPESSGAVVGTSFNWPSLERRRPQQRLDESYYRVVALPADYALTDDVILTDERGHTYLLSHTEEEPTPIEDETANSLGMFFEPSQDYSWHTASELRRMIYGIEDVSPSSN
jgi:hypothetical protein